MKNVTYDKYSNDEVEGIMNDRKDGMSVAALAKKYGRTVGALYTLTSDFRKFVKEGTTNNKRMAQVFTELQQKGVAPIQAYEAGTLQHGGGRTTEDVFLQLEEATKAYQDKVTNFITSMVELQVGSIREENEAIRTMRTKLVEKEKELLAYKKAFSEMKDANWIDNLKRKFVPVQL